VTIKLRNMGPRIV